MFFLPHFVAWQEHDQWPPSPHHHLPWSQWVIVFMWGCIQWNKWCLLMVVIYSIMSRLCESWCFISILAWRWGTTVVNVKCCSPPLVPAVWANSAIGLDKNGFFCTCSHIKQVHTYTQRNNQHPILCFLFKERENHCMYIILTKCHCTICSV